MTTKSREAEREAFEKWAVNSGLSIAPEKKWPEEMDYDDPDTEEAWGAWQSAWNASAGHHRSQALDPLGKGVPDLLVLHRNRLMLVECKNGKKPPSARKLTPDQEEFHQRWQGPHLVVVKSWDEAIAALNSKEIA